MNCPRDRSPLARDSFRGRVTLDRCGTCGGVWLDPGELSQIVGLGEDLTGLFGLQLDEAVRLACPACGAEMISRWFSPSRRVLVDQCQACCGIWLDEGELRSILKQVYGLA